MKDNCKEYGLTSIRPRHVSLNKNVTEKAFSFWNNVILDYNDGQGAGRPVMKG